MKETDMGFEACTFDCVADTDRLDPRCLMAYKLPMQEWEGSTPEERYEAVMRASSPHWQMMHSAKFTFDEAGDLPAATITPQGDVLQVTVTGSGCSRKSAPPPKSRGEEIAETLPAADEFWTTVYRDDVEEAIDAAIAEEREAWLRALDAYIPYDDDVRQQPWGNLGYPDWLEILIRGRFTNMESFHESRVKRMVEAERDRILMLAREQLGLHNGESWQDVHQHIVRAAGAR